MFNNDPNYLDQHFLIDEDIIKLFLSTCHLKATDTAVEIGPGKGIMTKVIAPRVKKLTVIEKDLRLKPYLDSINNINIIYGSVLDIKIPECDKIITSLPYSITEPFIFKLIHTDFKELIMICGARYANSVKEQELTKLSLLTNAFFKLAIIKEITPDAFKPKPRVMSALVTLEPIDITKLSSNELIYHYLFLRNKQLVKNALREIIINLKKLTKKNSKAFINQLNIPDAIGNKVFETLSNDDLKELDKYITKITTNN
jgi:16S rRNA (adenine1518-N6/adenine1519-N6)-dimethyltransferase